MPERPPSFQEMMLAGYRLVPVDTVDGSELQRRLDAFFKELPRLKIDYVAYIEAHHQDSQSLTLEEFDQLCKALSLRTEVFTEFDNTYFNETFKQNLAIARKRGSHEQ